MICRAFCERSGKTAYQYDGAHDPGIGAQRAEKGQEQDIFHIWLFDKANAPPGGDQVQRQRQGVLDIIKGIRENPGRQDEKQHAHKCQPVISRQIPAQPVEAESGAEKQQENVHMPHQIDIVEGHGKVRQAFRIYQRKLGRRAVVAVLVIVKLRHHIEIHRICNQRAVLRMEKLPGHQTAFPLDGLIPGKAIVIVNFETIE